MSADLERVLADLDAEVEALVERDLCGCGCGEPLPRARHARRRYVAEHHRQRQYQRRLEAEARALGVPTRLSLRELEAMERTPNRPSDAESGRTAPKRRRSTPRPGVTLYLPTVDVALDVLLRLEDLARVEGRADLADLAERLERALERRRRRDERA